ncbi:MAG: flagellar biosynthetic protein FliO [Deltaproteobacteria bacterium]|nr:flagellar biosynthetic protein FliO [Deltaproteobacteria bacterium]
MMETGISFGWLLVKTIGAMAFILGLAYVVIRYLFPLFRFGGQARGSHIQIIDRAGLEPRRSLFIVRIGKKTALLGTSEQGIAKLMDLEESDVKE